MKQTKRVHHINAVCLSLLVLITSAACSKKSSSSTPPPTHVYCVGITCQNGGTCALDVCSCPAGYNGTYCEYLSRNQYLGTFIGVTSYQYMGIVDTVLDTLVIAADTDPTKVDIYNLKGDYPYKILPMFVCTMSPSQTFYNGNWHGFYPSKQDSIDGRLTFFLSDPSSIGSFTGIKQ